MLIGLLALVSFAHAAENVVFITVDGVRYQEFFKGVRKPFRAHQKKGTPTFPLLHAAVDAGEGWIYGDESVGEKFWVGNKVAMSLPGYRSLLSGEFEDRCRSNRCAQTDRETMIDSLARSGLKKEEVGVFASWNKIDRAIESLPSKIFKNIAFQDYPEVPTDAAEAAFVSDMTGKSRSDLPKWEDSRRDLYTYALGKNYLEKHRPRFLYLSFVDSDELAHRNDYRGYIDSVRQYDVWISEIRESLKAMGEYGENTSIVITTDHGRFVGPLWGQHGVGLRTGVSSFRTWAVVIPSLRMRESKIIAKRVGYRYDQLDIRPTIEGLLGMTSAPTALRTGASLVNPAAEIDSLGK